MLSLVIPAFNEDDAIAATIEDVKGVLRRGEIPGCEPVVSRRSFLTDLLRQNMVKSVNR